jgi:predicted site-specific integrase-resolvase
MQDDPLADYPPMMRPEHVAKFLDVTLSRLAQWRSEGTGPAYHKLTPARNGTVRYPREEFREYLAQSRRDVSAEVPS